MLKIDLAESFPLLARAPIVEAVVNIRARAEAVWEESRVSQRVKSLLPEYPIVQSLHEFDHTVNVVFGRKDVQPEQTIQDLGWGGLRCESADRRQIVHFGRSGFLFSRLTPYESWDRFHREALRLWQLHTDLTQPMQIQRMGLRFINRMMVPRDSVRLEDYLEAAPHGPRDLNVTCAGFFHRTVLSVPGNAYGINFVQTMQPPHVAEAADVGLILDIDVFTTQPFDADRSAIDQRLAEMRWLKNKTFFGGITPKTLEMLK